MLKEHSAIIRRLALITDMSVICLAFFLAYALRSSMISMRALEHYLLLLPPLMLIWGVSFDVFGMYRSMRMKTVPEIFSVIFKTNICAFIFYGTFLYIFKFDYVSRLFVVFIFAGASILITAEKILLLAVSAHIRRIGFNYRQVLVIGTGRRAQAFIERIQRHSEWGMRVIGLIDDDPARTGTLVKGHTILGSLDDFPAVLRANVVDDVLFVVPRSWLYKVEGLIKFCELQGIKIHVALDYFDLKLARAKIGDLYGQPLLTFESTTDKIWALLGKRVVDILASASGLLILSPALALIAIAIKLSSPGPVFFRQTRCGLNGRTFTLLKFRSMSVNAETQLDDLKALNEMNGPVFKLKNDPRITSVGKGLRKFSGDELPQLWNVLKGDMSLVGPRPPLPSEVKEYDDWQRRRLSMRPGITCLWQVNGRNRITDFSQWVKLDLEYIDTWSPWLDIKILFKTLPVVVFGIGAK